MIFWTFVLGPCPRLVWRCAFGAQHSSRGPKARFDTSLGQRPRKWPSIRLRAESPTYDASHYNRSLIAERAHQKNQKSGLNGYYSHFGARTTCYKAGMREVSQWVGRSVGQWEAVRAGSTHRPPRHFAGIPAFRPKKAKKVVEYCPGHISAMAEGGRNAGMSLRKIGRRWKTLRCDVFRPLVRERKVFDIQRVSTLAPLVRGADGAAHRPPPRPSDCDMNSKLITPNKTI